MISDHKIVMASDRELNAEEKLKQILGNIQHNTLPTDIDSSLLCDLKTVHYPLMKGYPILLRDIIASIDAMNLSNVTDIYSLPLSSLVNVLNELGVKGVGSREPDFMQIWPAIKSEHKQKYDYLMECLNKKQWRKSEKQLDSLMTYWTVFHDGFVRCIHEILENLLQSHGSKPILTVLKKAGEKSKDAYEKWSKLESSQLMTVIESLLHAHGSHFSRLTKHSKINQRDEVIGLDIQYCASGGMLLKDQPVSEASVLSLVEEKEGESPLSYRFNRSTYCAHCVLWNEQLPTVWFGKPFFTTVPDADSANRCRIYFDNERLPEYFQRQYLITPDVDF